MRRSHFVSGITTLTAGVAVASQGVSVSQPPSVKERRRRRDLLQVIYEAITADPPERYMVNATHMNWCINGNFDHLITPEEVAKRKARCAGVCLGCRYPKSEVQRGRYEKWLRGQVARALGDIAPRPPA